jgi:hypothetical protein
MGGENPFPLSGAMHPGMLSAALQGNLPPSHQPPTPPRTPQGHQNKYEENRQQQGMSMMPKMPSLLAMAGLQQQMLSKPGMPPLPAHMNKQGLQGKQIPLSSLIFPNLQRNIFGFLFNLSLKSTFST